MSEKQCLNYTTLIFEEQCDGDIRTASIEVGEAYLPIEKVIEELLMPLLLAAGYSQKVIDNELKD